jgi:hypothetical protein
MGSIPLLKFRTAIFFADIAVRAYVLLVLADGPSIHFTHIAVVPVALSFFGGNAYWGHRPAAKLTVAGVGPQEALIPKLRCVGHKCGIRVLPPVLLVGSQMY